MGPGQSRSNGERAAQKQEGPARGHAVNRSRRQVTSCGRARTGRIRPSPAAPAAGPPCWPPPGKPTPRPRSWPGWAPRPAGSGSVPPMSRQRSMSLCFAARRDRAGQLSRETEREWFTSS